MTTIKLPKNKILNGKEYGEEVRRELKIDSLDKSTEDIICVLISQDTWALNTSFFIGCFYASVKKLGRYGFENRFRFTFLDNCVCKQVDDGIILCEKLAKYEEEKACSKQ